MSGVRVTEYERTACRGTRDPNAAHMELELLVKSGLSPLEAIITGTRNAAEVIGRADDLGTIEPGKLADLVVMAGDPLADISASRDIQLVVKDGTIVLDRLRPQHGHLH